MSHQIVDNQKDKYDQISKFWSSQLFYQHFQLANSSPRILD